MIKPQSPLRVISHESIKNKLPVFLFRKDTFTTFTTYFNINDKNGAH